MLVELIGLVVALVAAAVRLLSLSSRAWAEADAFPLAGLHRSRPLLSLGTDTAPVRVDLPHLDLPHGAPAAPVPDPVRRDSRALGRRARLQ